MDDQTIRDKLLRVSMENRELREINTRLIQAIKELHASIDGMANSAAQMAACAAIACGMGAEKSEIDGRENRPSDEPSRTLP